MSTFPDLYAQAAAAVSPPKMVRNKYFIINLISLDPDKHSRVLRKSNKILLSAQNNLRKHFCILRPGLFERTPQDRDITHWKNVTPPTIIYYYQ